MQQVVTKVGETFSAQDDGALLHAVTQFSFADEGADPRFVDRLARENCWTGEFAQRVVDEYRRFVILAVSASHPVTPSWEVDQAWHLHLMYTRSYWEDLCAGVLGRPLHHTPSAGGPHEREKFRRQYSRTLESYARLFGATPPKDIWPDVDSRFAPVSRFARIDTGRNWVIPKPWRRANLGIARRYAAMAVAAVGILIAVAALSASFVGEVSVGSSRRTVQLASGDGAGLAVFAVVVGLIIGVSVFFDARCPACHRRKALTRTGATRKRGWWRSTQEEWVCGNCAHIVWKAEPSEDGCGCG